MNLPKTADGATICYGDTVYYLWYNYYEQPEIRTLIISEKNIRLINGLWLIERPESRDALHPKNVYRDRRRVVTFCRNYWKEKIKEVRAKLKVWNDDRKVRRLCKEIKNGLPTDQT